MDMIDFADPHSWTIKDLRDQIGLCQCNAELIIPSASHITCRNQHVSIYLRSVRSVVELYLQVDGKSGYAYCSEIFELKEVDRLIKKFYLWKENCLYCEQKLFNKSRCLNCF